MSKAPRTGFSRWLLGGAPIPRAETFESAPADILPPSRDTGELTIDRALAITSVFRAVTILSTTCSQLTLGVWRGDDELETPSVVRQPDPDRPLSAFLKRTVVNLALFGNAYWMVDRNARGEVVNLRVLDPNRVHVSLDQRGSKTYGVSTVDGKSRTYDDRRVQHLRLLEVPGNVYGLGPIQAGRGGLNSARQVEEYAANWFDKGGVPTGTLNTAQNLDPDTTAALQAAWAAMLSESKTAILGSGTSYNPIFLNPADAQWLETKQFSVTEVARLFGIPAAYLLAEVNGSSMTYSNISQLNTVFHQTTLMSYLSEIEDALSILLPRGQAAKFKVDQLLRVDDQARYTAYSTALTAGFLTVDEVRAREGLPPLPEEPEPTPAPEPEPAAEPEPGPEPTEEAAA